MRWDIKEEKKEEKKVEQKVPKKKRAKNLIRDESTIGAYYKAWNNFDAVIFRFSIKVIYLKGC